MEASTRSQKNKEISLSLKPNELKTIPLGIYEQESDIPEFAYETLPDVGDGVAVYPSNVKMVDGIHLIYQFQSYAHQTVMVFLKQADV
ncbi:MAG TPA: hypothetical protein VGX23_23615 [Actinocrinis sp.]|nr:hypothetical protein [Actinocrinis sp.]